MSLRPSAFPGFRSGKKVRSAPAHAQTQREKKKSQGPRAREKGAKEQRGAKGQRVPRAKGFQRPNGPRAKARPTATGQHQQPKQRQERKKNGTLRAQLGKSSNDFIFFLFLKSCILISICVAQVVTIRMNLSESQHKSYSSALAIPEVFKSSAKELSCSSAFKIDHTSI